MPEICQRIIIKYQFKLYLGISSNGKGISHSVLMVVKLKDSFKKRLNVLITYCGNIELITTVNTFDSFMKRKFHTEKFSNMIYMT
jgi:hypothetical protein